MKIPFAISILLLLSLSIQAAANPADSEFVIAIDVGHCNSAKGAVSSRGVPEYEFNKNLGNLLLNRLLLAGFPKAFIIDKTGETCNLRKRTSIAEKSKADLLISIHHDSVQNHYLKSWVYAHKTLAYSDKYSGYSLFYSDRNPKRKESLLLRIPS